MAQLARSTFYLDTAGAALPDGPYKRHQSHGSAAVEVHRGLDGLGSECNRLFEVEAIPRVHHRITLPAGTATSRDVPTPRARGRGATTDGERSGTLLEERSTAPLPRTLAPSKSSPARRNVGEWRDTERIR